MELGLLLPLLLRRLRDGMGTPRGDRERGKRGIKKKNAAFKNRNKREASHRDGGDRSALERRSSQKRQIATLLEMKMLEGRSLGSEMTKSKAKEREERGN